MTIESFLDYFTFFYIYAFCGWCIEIAYHAITKGHFVNRGMLSGPVCPIYGAGMVAMLLLLSPVHNSWGLTFLGAFVVCSALELVVGLVLRWLFQTQWWDYSDQRLNISGLVCLRFSIYWGVGGAFLVKAIHPLLREPIAHLPNLALILFLAFASAILACDLIITVSTILRINARNTLLAELDEQMDAITLAIGTEVADLTLDAHERLQPLENHIHALQQEGRDELEELQTELHERLRKLDARFDTQLQEYADNAAALRAEVQAQLAQLRTRREAIWESRPRMEAKIEARIRKAFPTLKPYGKHIKHH